MSCSKRLTPGTGSCATKTRKRLHSLQRRSTLLEEDGPNLARPLADRIEGSTLHNLKELRPGSTGTSEVRILFIFDPQRQAVLLVAGDKSDQWSKWYAQSIPIAETRYERWLAGEYNDEIGE